MSYKLYKQLGITEHDYVNLLGQLHRGSADAAEQQAVVQLLGRMMSRQEKLEILASWVTSWVDTSRDDRE